ncbi:MAG: YolD-like family protein [Bacilli bacterium]
MSDRGMKKWVAYKSLVEQDQFLQAHKYNKERIEHPVLLDDQIEKINRILTDNIENLLNITYFKNGYLYKEEGKIKKIDMNSHVIYINENAINLKDLIDIEILD